MNGSDDVGQFEWAALDDTPNLRANKCMSDHDAEIVDAARVPNSAYVAWFQSFGQTSRCVRRLAVRVVA